MDALEYRYRPKPWIMLLATLFFGGIGPFLVNEALTNKRGLVVQRFIHLSPQEATIVYWVLAVFCGLFVVAGIAGFITGLTSKQFVRLTATELSAPKFAWSRTNTVVPLADIVDLAVQSVQKQRFLNVRHRGGKLTINQSFLPDAAAFEQLCSAIVARKRSAG